MKLSSIRIIFIFLFIILYTAVVYFNTQNKETLITQELEQATKILQTNYDITVSTYKNDTKAMNFSIKHNQELLDLLYKIKYADDTQKVILRKRLYDKLLPRYNAIRLKGVLQFQFILANNISFLRMHEPLKFGDDLSNVRYSFKYTNKTHLPSSGFEQDRTAHAFRNVFPIFHTNGEYLGCYEVSYTSESMQKNLTEINKIHSHFLVNKMIFEEKAWKREHLILKYTKSIENDNYMFTLSGDTDHNRLEDSKKYIIQAHKNEINKKMSRSEKFAIYQKLDDSVKIVAFLPIKNIKDTMTAAYIVSYTDSAYIFSILQVYNLINILSFIFLSALFYLLYKQLLSKKRLLIKSEEQTQLLSLFDNGEITLFKWKNNESWSVESVSKNVEKLTGYSQSDFIQNKVAYASLIDKDSIEFVTAEVHRAIEKKVDFFTHKPYKILTKENEIKWVHDITTIIRDENAEIVNFLGYIIDITDMKMLELEVYELNKNLYAEVTKQTGDNRRKDKLLQEQSKLAAMGEMVGSIAHQWRQPLNSLNINIQNLDDDYEDGLVDKKFIDEFIKKQTKTIKFMSQTIDDFRNFFRVDKVKKDFSIKQAIESTISIQSAQFKNYNISTELIGEDFSVNAIESEFLQVILNIITNAKDAIIENNIAYGLITIILEKDTKTITISDNAGGIPKEIKGRIFEPYFTTKEQGKGTGMGLYMSKIIIEQNMGGVLKIENKDILSKESGAIFKIILT